MKMQPISIPDAPLIRNMMATGYPDGMDPQEPRCPVCGKECETVYYDNCGRIAGCENCIREKDALDTPECFPDREDVSLCTGQW